MSSKGSPTLAGVVATVATGMEDELPTALVEEQAYGEVGADGGDGNGDSKGAKQPTRRDEGLLLAEGVNPSGRRNVFGARLRISGAWYDQPNASSSGLSSGVPQTRQMTAEQSPQTSGSLTGRAQVGHQSFSGSRGAGVGWG